MNRKFLSLISIQVLLFCFCTNKSVAQQKLYIQNPSFEDATKNPNSGSQYAAYAPPPWERCRVNNQGNCTGNTEATPDLNSQSALGIAPADSSFYMGAYAINDTNVDCHGGEAFFQKLCKPMEKGITYTFKISVACKNYWSNAADTGYFGVYGGNNLAPLAVLNNPTVLYKSKVNSLSWTTFTVTITPDSSYDYLVIGAFSAKGPPVFLGPWPYLLFDNITDIATSCSPTYCSSNLITNPSLETCSNANGCGNNEMRLTCSKVEGWYGVTGASSPSTPDYFGVSCNNPTINTCGSGSTMGFYTTATPFSKNLRENVQGKLLQPLVAGKKYSVEFKVWAQQGTTLGGQQARFMDGLGACFTRDRVNFDTLGLPNTLGQDNVGFLGLNYTPQVQNPTGNFITNVCQTFSQTFIATGGERWMAIGNFRSDSLTQFQTTPGVSYLYIDDVSVREIDCSGFTITANDTSICEGQCTDIVVKSQDAIQPLSYSWNGSPFVANDSIHQICNLSTTTTYSVIAIDAANDTAKTTFTITIAGSTPTADAGPDKIICPQQGDTTLTLTVYGGSTYIWSTGESTQSISVRPTETTLYTVTVQNNCGTASDVVEIQVQCAIEIPNVITPNDDPDNQYFIIKGLEGYPNSRVEIYDRWGIKMYESNNYLNDWDGKNYKTKTPVTDGVYYYILYLSNKEKKVYTGFVQVLR